MGSHTKVGKHTRNRTELSQQSSLGEALIKQAVLQGAHMNSSFRLAGLCCLTAFVASGQTVHSVGNIFDPRATPAESVYHLSLLVLAVCAAIFLVVAGLLTYTLVRFRGKSGDRREPAQVYGSDRIEIAWTVIPILIVFVLTMATARIVSATLDRPTPSDNCCWSSVVVGSSVSDSQDCDGERSTRAREHSIESCNHIPQAGIG